MQAAGQKDPGALLTIGELSQELGVAQHILRYWETRFPQLAHAARRQPPLLSARPTSSSSRRINRLLNQEGYTVRGVQKVLREKGESGAPEQLTPHLAAVAAAGPHLQWIVARQAALTCSA